MPMYSLCFAHPEDEREALRGSPRMNPKPPVWVWADNIVQVALVFPCATIIEIKTAVAIRSVADHDLTLIPTECLTHRPTE
jgi:hypothetical protein